MGSSTPTNWDDHNTPSPRTERDRVRQLIQELAEGEPSARLLPSMSERSRLEDLEQRSCTLAHELRQPLFTIAMANENLRLMLESADVRSERMLQSVARIAEQLDRAQAIIAHTLTYARDLEVRSESGNFGEAASNAIRFFKEMLERAEITVEVHGTEGLPLVGISRIEMEQVFVNLLRNAAQSIAERRAKGWQGAGRIVIVAQQVQGEIRCIVVDNGAGLLPDMSEAVFQPFFTTKAREGTGLGLHICRQIMAKADGVIRLLPGRDEGALVDIRVPFLADPPGSGIVTT